MRSTTALIAALALAATAVTGVAHTASAAPPSRADALTVLADLRADTNRDGSVDLTGTSDEALEATSSALVLPNIDDDSRRYQPRTKAQRAAFNRLSDQRLNAMNDGADTVINGASDLLDLAPVLTVPQPATPANAVGHLKVTPGGKLAHVFVRTAKGWRLVTPKTTFTAQQLREGLTLAAEATDIVRTTSTWDGTITIRLTVTAGDQASSDTVTLKVAPMLSHTHTQRTQTVLIARTPTTSWERDRRTFNRAFAPIVKKAGVRYRELKADDIWAQDFFEPMYASVPRGDGAQTIRLLLRSDQNRLASRSLYYLRGRDAGVVWLGATKDDNTLDSFGNLETIPAYAHNGQSFPAGRIVMGAQPTLKTAPSARLLRTLRAQGLQTPLLLDTSFLAVGHVDEIIQFLPADTPRGWRLAAADPLAAIDLLRQAQTAGQGKQTVLRKDSGVNPNTLITVNTALGTGPRSIVANNQRAAMIITKNIELIKAETGITDEEIVRIPVLFKKYDDWATTANGASHTSQALAGNAKAAHPARGVRDGNQTALLPNALNSLLLTPTQVVAGKQFGVLVGGRDLFADAAAAAYASAGITVTWINDIAPYHLGDGEVHCGTNSLREISPQWWSVVQ